MLDSLYRGKRNTIVPLDLLPSLTPVVFCWVSGGNQQHRWYWMNGEVLRLKLRSLQTLMRFMLWESIERKSWSWRQRVGSQRSRTAQVGPAPREESLPLRVFWLAWCVLKTELCYVIILRSWKLSKFWIFRTFYFSWWKNCLVSTDQWSEAEARKTSQISE